MNCLVNRKQLIDHLGSFKDKQHKLIHLYLTNLYDIKKQTPKEKHQKKLLWRLTPKHVPTPSGVSQGDGFTLDAKENSNKKDNREISKKDNSNKKDDSNKNDDSNKKDVPNEDTYQQRELPKHVEGLSKMASLPKTAKEDEEVIEIKEDNDLNKFLQYMVVHNEAQKKRKRQKR